MKISGSFWLQYIGLFDEDKKEIKHEITTIQDVFKFKTVIIETLQRLLG